MSTLTLSFLGSFHGQNQGISLANYSKKALGLLAYLAIEDTHRASREKIIELLWPTINVKAARNNLSKTLGLLRRISQSNEADAPYILATRYDIQLNPSSSYETDIDKFIESIKIGAIDSLEKAVQLYRSELLQGFSLSDCAEFEEWLLIKREYYQRLALDAIHSLATYYLDSSDYEKAQYYTRRHLELDEWSEKAHHHLMDIFVRQGQYRAASEHYETYRHDLEKEFGLTPSVTLTELFKQRHVSKFKQAKSTPLSFSHLSISTHNIPTHLTPFIGREEELKKLHQAILAPEQRLVSIVGISGVGKSRLAISIANQVASSFDDGVWVVPLHKNLNAIDTERLADNQLPHEPFLPDDFARTILQTFGFKLADVKSPRSQLFSYLNDKKLLLILDNLEYLLERVDFILSILEVAPLATIIVTSTELLNIETEYVLHLEGLPVPPSEGITNDDFDLSEYDSMQLFVERAKCILKNFELNQTNRRDVIQICQLVEGVPLGIEMAATWLQHFTCREIAQAIQQNLNFLSFRRRDKPERHQSLNAVFEYAWSLLSDYEQHSLARMSIFQGAFSRDAALAITNTTLATLASLVNKSLLRQPTVGRYEIRGLLRHYALKKLESFEGGQGQDGLTQERHSNYYLNFANERIEALFGRKPQRALREIQAEIDNIRQAYSWIILKDRVDILNQHFHGIASVYLLLGQYQRGETLIKFIAERVSGYANKQIDPDHGIKLLGKLYILYWTEQISES